MTETWRPHVDGVVTRLGHTVDDLLGRGHRVLVIAPTTGPGASGLDQHQTPGNVVSIIDRARRWGAPDPRLAETVSRFRPDVVHLVNPVLMGSVAARQLRGRWPLITSLHTDIDAYAARYRLRVLRPALRRLTRGAYRRAEVVLATSATGVGLVAALGRDDATIWPAGVDDTLLADLTRTGIATGREAGTGSRSHLEVLCVGRLAREKGYDVLVPVATSAAGRSRLALTFVGEGPDRTRLERIFSGAEVTFLGLRRGPELAAAYGRADVLAFTSLTDTVGLVLLEAAAAGLPIVAVDAPSTRDALEGYPRAFFVPLAAELAAWSAAFGSAVSSPAAFDSGWVPRSWHEATDVLLQAYAHARSRSRGRR